MAQPVDPLTEACGDDPSFACEMVFDWTGSELWAKTAEWAVERPLRIVLILVVAWLVSKILRRAVDHWTVRLAAEREEYLEALRDRGPGRGLIDERESGRAAARAETITVVLKSVVSVAVWSIATLLVLSELSIDLAPLLAGAGIAGIALGFGAQSVVKDFLTGLFMLIEDQYGLGDVIDAGPAVGTVEKVSLRTTTIRDVQGTVWHVPNGEILRVGNHSQLWSRALIDVDVAYEADLRAAMDVVARVGHDMWDDPEWGDEIMDEPEVWGVQNLGVDGIAIRVVVKTEPSMQWMVERELRLRLKEAFDAAGIDIPFPQRTVWLHSE